VGVEFSRTCLPTSLELDLLPHGGGMSLNVLLGVYIFRRGKNGESRCQFQAGISLPGMNRSMQVTMERVPILSWIFDLLLRGGTFRNDQY
jgi:hypothetical protein